MPTITYIEHNGTEHQIEAEVGATLMQTALDNGVPGIDGDCGGECSCATCHVMVKENWTSTVGGPNESEEEMLDLNPERLSNSRLSCQIEITDDLDGLVVELPEFQF
jgi:2Fe-2S ferredoxin